MSQLIQNAVASRSVARATCTKTSLLRLPVPRDLISPRTRRTTSINRLDVPHNASIIRGAGGIRGRARGANPEVEVDCSVVLTVSAELKAAPLGFSAAGLKIHDTPFGNKELLGQLRATDWLKLLMGDTVTV